MTTKGTLQGHYFKQTFIQPNDYRRHRLYAYIHFTSFSEIVSEVLTIKANIFSFHLQWIELPFGVHNCYTTTVRGEGHTAHSTLLCNTEGQKQDSKHILCPHNQLVPLTTLIAGNKMVYANLSTNTLCPCVTSVKLPRALKLLHKRFLRCEGLVYQVHKA